MSAERKIDKHHFTDTVVVGAGHSGLAASYCLSQRSIDHVVIERGEVANSWRNERWDSLKLLTPNWQSSLPGFSYSGNDPDGFMSMTDVVGFIEDYARWSDAPVHTSTTVQSIDQTATGYRVKTNQGTWDCRTLVIASGACNLPTVPRVSQAIPESIEQLAAQNYRNPEQLNQGGVLLVGASATGLQLAQEIQNSGRQVTLAVGEHVRMPRHYRGKDIQWWMNKVGVLAEGQGDIDDINRARHLPSPQLIGSNEHPILDLNVMSDLGVRLAGRLMGVNNGVAQFSGSLRNVCALADLKMNRLLDRIDEWALESSFNDAQHPAQRFERTRIDEVPCLALNLAESDIRTIIWATGYRPDYSWLNVPVLDRKGLIRHEGGVVDAPGMYLLGMPFLRHRKSSYIHGIEDDAQYISQHLAHFLQQNQKDN